jgi:succinate-acetate transporter protein
MSTQEVQMQDSVVCPYFDHDEDVCDVGCGYISSHDASMIIKFCSCQHQDCPKYRELSDLVGKPPEKVSATRPIRSTSINDDHLPVMGLASYSLTVACYSLDKLPIVSLNLHLLAIMLMLGAAGQITAGLNALKTSPLKAISFTGFGLFWLSMLALDILPRAGYGSVPGSIPMMGYFAMWGMFSLIICQGLEQITRTCRTVFAMMTSFLLLLAMAHAINSTALLHSSALVGLASSLPGIYLGLRHLGKEVLQLVQPGIARSGKVRP